jgi:hypothetical protein
VPAWEKHRVSTSKWHLRAKVHKRIIKQESSVVRKLANNPLISNPSSSVLTIPSYHQKKNLPP